MTIGISLGWNCTSATVGVDLGIRRRKCEGYLTCPFDECVSNLPGILECLKDDFKDFCNSDYLKLIEAPLSTGYTREGEKLLYNTKYNFIFNHESPGHGDLYIHQNWSGGINHYIDNDFHFFKERYNKRINAFRNYIKSGDKIIFIITRLNDDFTDFHNTIKECYPSLNYEIHHLFYPDLKGLIHGHLKLMLLDKEVINKELGE